MAQAGGYKKRRYGGKGFVRTATLLQERIRSAGESRGFAISRLLTHWVEIVGQDMAKMARPVHVKYGRDKLGATLTVLTTGAQAPMLEMQKEALRSKVNSCYGYSAISRIRITQTAPVGFAEGQAQFEAAPKAKPAAPTPEIKEAAHQAVAPIADGGLRDALEALGQNIISRSRQ